MLLHTVKHALVAVSTPKRSMYAFPGSILEANMATKDHPFLTTIWERFAI